MFFKPDSLWERLSSIPLATFGRAESFEDFKRRVQWQAYNVDLIQKRPVFSIITRSLDGASIDAWARTEASLLLQSYPHWEWLTPSGSPRLTSAGSTDPRRIDRSEKDLDRVGGDYVCFLAPGEILSPAALFLLAVELQRNSAPDIWYTNFSEGAKQPSFYSMPEWNFEDFVHLPLLAGAVFVKSEWLKKAPRADFFFHCQEQGARFKLFPNYLLHRETPSLFTQEKAKAQATGVRGYLERTGIAATVSVRQEGKNWSVKVQPTIAEPQSRLITAIVCFRDLADSTILALDFLLKQRGQIPLEIVLVNNQSKRDELAKIETAIKSYPVPVQIIHYDGAFNYARMHNLAVEQFSHGELILTLNNDVFWEGENELDELAAWALRESTGTVGVKLTYPDGRLQHAGLRASFGGEARLVRVGNAQSNDRFATETHSVFGSTFALCLFRKEVFRRVGGLREVECANGFGDLVFSFECLKLGLRNLYLGHIRALHEESASRGEQYQYWEECQVERQYPALLQQMLRYDVGENRLAGTASPWPAVKEYFSQQLSRRAPWMKVGLKRLAWKFQR